MKLASLILAFFLLSASISYSAVWNGIRLKPYAGLSETFDDNVTFQKDNTVSDFITSFDGGLAASYETHLSTVELLGTLHYNQFASHDEFSNVSGDLSFDWKQELSMYDRIELRDTYVHSDEPVSFADAFNSRAGRFAYQTNSFQLSGEHDFTSQWSGTARYGNEFTIFSSNVFRDTTMNTVGAGALYHLDSMTDLSFDYDFEMRDFDGGSSANDHRLMAGVRRHFTQWFYFDGKFGADLIDPFVGKSLSEPRLEARLTDEINPTTTLDLAFEKQHSLNAYAEDVFNHWQISSSLKKEWTKRLRSVISFFYGDGKYVVSAVEDKLVGANASVSYDLTKNLEVKIQYNFTDVSSEISTREYQKNVVFLGFKWNF